MSMRTIARSSSKRKSASDFASSVLPVPVGPRKRNEPVGRLRVADARARAAYGVADRGHRGALADQPLADDLLHREQLGGLALEHPAGGDAGPGLDDLGDLLGADLLADQRLEGRTRSPRRPRRAPARARGSCRRGSRWPRRAGPRASAGRPGPGRCRGGDAARPRPRATTSPAPSGPRARAATPPCRRGRRAACSSRSVGGGVALLLEGELLHLEPVDLAAELVDLLRARTRSPCAAATPPRRSGRSPCRAAGGR